MGKEHRRFGFRRIVSHKMQKMIDRLGSFGKSTKAKDANSISKTGSRRLYDRVESKGVCREKG